jgi:hypothetical protein
MSSQHSFYSCLCVSKNHSIKIHRENTSVLKSFAVFVFSRRCHEQGPASCAEHLFCLFLSTVIKVGFTDLQWKLCPFKDSLIFWIGPKCFGARRKERPSQRRSWRPKAGVFSSLSSAAFLHVSFHPVKSNATLSGRRNFTGSYLEYRTAVEFPSHFDGAAVFSV